MNKIEEINLMQKHPRLYLANYFNDLKRDFDLEFALKPEKNEKYLEIINIIELFERNSYNKIKSFNELLTDQDLDQLEYKIGQKIFSNKTILWYKKTFLLIINDEYIRKNKIISNNLDYFNREALIIYFLKKEINKMKNIQNLLSLNMDILNKTSINITKNSIKEIHSNTFNDLINLESICFVENQIENLNPFIFNGLNSLKKINFKCNLIKELNSNLFNCCTNLEIILLQCNEIKLVDSNVFNGLKNLNFINLSNNEIKKLPSDIFNGLISLKYINFDNNQLDELHSNLFKGLISLKEIHFSFNKIKYINSNLFNGLSKLEKINLTSNLIKNINLFTFDGLDNLKYINLTDNRIKMLNLNTFILSFRYAFSRKSLYIHNDPVFMRFLFYFLCINKC